MEMKVEIPNLFRVNRAEYFSLMGNVFREASVPAVKSSAGWNGPFKLDFLEPHLTQVP